MDPNTQADVEQLVSIWTETSTAPDTSQLTKDDAARNQQAAQAQAEIAAAEKQAAANDQAVAAAEAKTAAVDQNLARLEGREEELEK